MKIKISSPELFLFSLLLLTWLGAICFALHSNSVLEGNLSSHIDLSNNVPAYHTDGDSNKGVVQQEARPSSIDAQYNSFIRHGEGRSRALNTY